MGEIGARIVRWPIVDIGLLRVESGANLVVALFCQMARGVMRKNIKRALFNLFDGMGAHGFDRVRGDIAFDLGFAHGFGAAIGLGAQGARIGNLGLRPAGA